MAVNSTIHGLIWPNFEPIQAFMVVFVTCKNKEDPIKNEGAREVTRLCFKRSRAANSKVSDGILPKFKLIRAFMVGLVTCKNEEDPSKNNCTRVVTIFLPFKVYGDFSRCSRAANSTIQSLIWPNFEPIQAFMVVLVLPARMKKIQSKMKALEWSQDYLLIFQTLKGSYLQSQ